MVKTCIVATAKDEGPFLLEWAAHHFAIGFDKIFVATNDISDATNEILDAMAQEYPIFRIENSELLDGETITTSAVRRCLLHPEMSDQDWALHIDIDEFLNIDGPNPDVSTFMAGFGDNDIVVFCWRIFGDGNFTFWTGGSILDTFLTCAENPSQGKGYKTFFRTSTFEGSAPHCPKRPLKPLSEIRAVTAQNAPLDTNPIEVDWMTSMRVPDENLSWEGASVSHYMHRSQDLTTAGRVFRGDANGRTRAALRRTVGHRDYEVFNLNMVEDRSIHATRGKRIEILNKMFAIPGLRKLHYDATQSQFNKIVDALEQV